MFNNGFENKYMKFMRANDPNVKNKQINFKQMFHKSKDMVYSLFIRAQIKNLEFQVKLLI